VRLAIDAVQTDPDPAKRFLPVQIQDPNFPGRIALGKLTFLDNSVQNGTGTIQLRAMVDENHDATNSPILWPGQFVRPVRLILRTLHNAMLVPNQALQVGQNGPYVFVISMSDMTVQMCPVTLGQRQADKTVVLTGLSPGQTVVTSGQLMLIPGFKVAIDPSAPSSQPASTMPSTLPVEKLAQR
jgi:membrane fusion protein, multidrug efflux system